MTLDIGEKLIMPCCVRSSVLGSGRTIGFLRFFLHYASLVNSTNETTFQPD